MVKKNFNGGQRRLKSSDLLIIIPAYNEEGSIQAVVDNIIQNYSQYDYVIINDGSRDRTSEICHKKNEPVFITKNGYGDLVVMSIETYDAMLETSQADNAISEAEKEFAEGGVLIDAREALSSLRRKYFE